ncbi:MAG: phenylalanine--tRNA ligase subunit alpha [Actinomycetota bacterium]|nr:phenylalanine--tRNA ligase subunit alpha [Actinomycetota bacterium]MDH5224916.1 phenylalanine--tRNA ligase subunit alpha [Actinomycetota bacterium]
MVRSLEAERARGVALFGAAETLDDLEAAQVEVMGRRSRFSAVQKAVGSVPPEDRKRVGQVANDVRGELQQALAARREALESLAEDALLDADRIDLTLPGRAPRIGSLHPLTIVEREAVEVFTSLGFRVAEGPEVEDDWHNFQALNIPEDHPARTMKDSLYVGVPGHPELLLRTETSAVQIRTMQSQPPPVFVVAPGRVYRRETSDPTHLPVFHQIEGLAVDEGITFADLKGTLEAFARAMFGERRRIRLGPAFFPFVEPGCEVGVSCFRCEGAGCRVCGTGWIELLGAGMVHPVVLENCGYDSERYTGFAFGLGIERVAMLRYEIADIRMLVDGDVRVLEQFQGVV